MDCSLVEKIQDKKIWISLMSTNLQNIRSIFNAKQTY